MTKNQLAPALLDKLESFLSNYSFGEEPNELYEPIRYILKLGGKRIRPLLSLLSYGLFQDDPEKILSQAAAVEVFHNFTLMHDDIMDQAPLRRGKETVHEKWNPNVAILSGDVMLVKAYELLLPTPSNLLTSVIQAFNQTAAEVCEGQQLDMNFEVRADVTEDEYLNMIRLKTAVLLGFALKLGAMLGQASEEDQKHLYNFGVSIGIGFQLKDDLLDVFADQSKFGKQVGGDIISNKKTFLLIKALELARNEDAETLNHWLKVEEFDPKEKVKEVKTLYEKIGVRKLAEEKMNEFFDAGFSQLEKIQKVNESYYQGLYDIAQALVHREK
ncbi:MAG: polyprenyl synthetase family protein [Algoriphagus sp.]|uniref:polyprenyl synthetase family protein n=1 Tax=Algoriphagus sp. TaxID=1872435 RepID=UPI00179EC714|nr:polyprenyl synthetase family protein [Algoriphagus sp.]NVJ87548.1 polyprenyl synthetase family protein [Algoriphagus sp.]